MCTDFRLLCHVLLVFRLIGTGLYREKPGDAEWIELDKLKIPLLLNYSQCKLIAGDYYTVITHTTEVLQKDYGMVHLIKSCQNAKKMQVNYRLAGELFFMGFSSTRVVLVTPQGA